MRRTHLRKHSNILKRQLIHVGAFNLSLILRKLMAAGTPREWRNRTPQLIFLLLCLLRAYQGAQRYRLPGRVHPKQNLPSGLQDRRRNCRSRNSRGSATDC
jgi:hypothetical protein